MIINTDKISARTAMYGKYIAVYGTQENPISGDYDLMGKDEAQRFVVSMKDAATRLIDEAEKITLLAEALYEE